MPRPEREGIGPRRRRLDVDRICGPCRRHRGATPDSFGVSLDRLLGLCGLWDGLKTGVGRIGSDDTRIVVVTKGPEAESESKLRELAPDGVSLVQSTEAWFDYEVPVSPYFVLVDGPSGSVIGEGSAGSWAQVSSLMTQALADAGTVKRDRLDNGEFRADAELRRAGILPGDPSLHQEERPQ